MKYLSHKTQIYPDLQNPTIRAIFDSQIPKRQTEVSKIWDKCNIFEITYISDGLKIKGFIVEPKKLKKLNPTLIFNRGGSKDFGIIDGRVLYFRLIEYANWGYVVIASQLRGSTGSEGKDEFGGDDMNDILNLKIVCEELGYIDTNRIVMLGGSRGGMMTYQALCKVDWIKTAIIESAPTDINHSYQYRPQLKEHRRDMYDVDSKSENQKRSALYFAHKINKAVPILLFHGTSDSQVSPLDTLKICEKLQENGNLYELHMYRGQDHMIRLEDKWTQTKNWLKKYL